MGAGGGVR
jgi:hypothetical protein